MFSAMDNGCPIRDSRQPGMTIPKKLLKAYEATTYVIHAPGGNVSFRVGRAAPGIDGLLEPESHMEWVFMTATNPFSKPASEAENSERQELLCKTLRLGGYQFLTGMGIGDGGDWPREPALFIPGMTREKGLAYGRVFEQYAIIHGRRGAAPEFVFSRVPG